MSLLEIDGQVVDKEYCNMLRKLKELLATSEDPNDTTICLRWIERLNVVNSGEKQLRNRCMHVLLQQLAENNLNYPFIFLQNLAKPIETLLQPLPENSNNKLMLSVQTILNHVQQLNQRIEQEHPPSFGSSLTSFSHELQYLQFLRHELQNVLRLQIPRMLANPEQPLPPLDDLLVREDSEWITAAMLQIQRHIQNLPCQAPHPPPSDSKNSQTVPADTMHKSCEMEAYYERKFAKLYANFQTLEKELEIAVQTGKWQQHSSNAGTAAAFLHQWKK